MALELDNEILQDFIEQTIDKITVKDGRIKSIQFVNGLKHEFIYIQPAQLQTCEFCGGRIGSTVGCRTRTFHFEKKLYHRIKVGDSFDDFVDKHITRCTECYAQKGRWHHWKCKKERCPICKNYLVRCEHGPKE